MIRIVIIGFILMTLVYISVSIYSRLVRKAKLEQWWIESDRSVDQDTYVRQGLKKYESSLRRKLILLVYIVPIVTVCALIYITNFM